MKKVKISKRLRGVFFASALIYAAIFSLLYILIFLLIPKKTVVIILSVVLFIFNFLLLLRVEYLAERLKRNEDSIYILEKENDLLMQNAKPMATKMEEVDKFRHDVRNYLSILSADKSSRTTDFANELLKYADELKADVLCENVILNILLQEKKSQAEHEGIKFECAVNVSEQIPIEQMDLCSVFFNLIDNAVFANHIGDDGSKKWITIKANVIGGYLVVKQSNSVYIDTQTDESGRFLTTKLNKSEHGRGTEIIKDIAQKYNGYCEFEEKNGIFYSTIYLKVI